MAKSILQQARSLASRLTPDFIEDPVKKKLQQLELARIAERREGFAPKYQRLDRDIARNNRMNPAIGIPANYIAGAAKNIVGGLETASQGRQSKSRLGRIGSSALGGLEIGYGLAQSTPLGAAAKLGETGLTSLFQTARTTPRSQPAFGGVRNLSQTFSGNLGERFVGPATTGLGLTGTAGFLGDLSLQPSTISAIGNKSGTFAKGFEFGRNKINSKWVPQDLGILDDLSEAIRVRKLSDAQLNNLDKVASDLANGYLPQEVIEKALEKWGSNQRGFIKEIIKELQKTTKGVTTTASYTDDLVFGLTDNRAGKANLSQPIKGDIGSIKQKYPDVKLDIYEKGDKLTLSRIDVPEGQRGRGIGTKVMNDLVKYADENKKTIKLTPERFDKPGIDKRLTGWYEKFGFNVNRGKNKDYSISEYMYRTPQPKGRLGGQEGFIDLSAEIETPAIIKKAQQKVKGLFGSSDGSIPKTSVIDDIKKGFREGEAERASVKGRTQGIRTQLVDRLSPVFDLTQKAGKELPAETNPYKRMRLLAGVSGKVEEFINSGLAPTLQKESSRLDDLSALLVLQREAELIGRGKTRARDVGQIREGLQELAQKHGDDGFRTLTQSANEVRQYGNKLLEMVHDAGVIDSKSFKEIKEANRFYVPFEIVGHIADNVEAGKFNNASFNVASQDVIKAIGDSKSAVGDPLQSILKKTSQVIALSEKNKAIKSLVDLRKQSDELAELIQPIKGDAPKGFEVVNLFENGKNVRYAVPEEVAAAVKNLDAESAGVLTKLLSPQAKLLRAGATGLNIGFIPANIVRDFADALFTEFTEGGAKQAAQYLASYPAAIFSALRKNGLYQQWLKEGGAQSTLTEEIFNKTPKTLKELSGNKSAVKSVLDSPKNLIEFANRVGEQSPRIARFRSGLKRGESAAEAAFKSRDVTLDFARAGNSVKKLNQVIPFLNAGVQGSEKLLRLAKDNPKRFIAASTALYAVPTAMLFKHNNQFKDYQDVPDAEKQNYWIIIARDRTPQEIANNEKIIGTKIPKGFLGRAVSTMTEGSLEFAQKRDPQALASMFMDVGESISPVGLPVGQERAGQFLSTITPPGIQAGIESATNQNLYFGNPIVPRRLENAPPELQVKDSTSNLARGIGKLTGTSPLKVENTIGTMTGGVGRQIGQLSSGDIKGATVDQITRRFSGIRQGNELDAGYDKQNLVSQAKFAIGAGKPESIPSDIPENERTYLTADYIYSKINSLAKSDKEGRRKLYEQYQGLITPEVEQRIVAISKLDESGLTKTDREMLLYDDRMRARKIVDRFDSLKSQEKKRELYNLYQQHGIMTPEIEELIVAIKRGN